MNRLLIQQAYAFIEHVSSIKHVKFSIKTMLLAVAIIFLNQAEAL